MGYSNLPSNLKSTLLDLESTILEWEKSEKVPSESKTETIDNEKINPEKELQKKAKELLYKLKSQIDDLS